MSALFYNSVSILFSAGTNCWVMKKITRWYLFFNPQRKNLHVEL